MVYRLTEEALHGIFPKAPPAIIQAFLTDQRSLDAAGITHTKPRLAIALAQVEHETSGFTIPNLTESVAYTALRATQVWPSRFKSVDDVYRKISSSPGDPPAEFRRKLINNVYGNRMGNRQGTDDGYRYIGRAGPQITGRDGYEAIEERTGLPAVAKPECLTAASVQPQVLAAFWSWKKLNPIADVGGLRAVTKPWNGGYVGMDDREARLAGNARFIETLKDVSAKLETIPGAPPTPAPPKEAIDDATEKERKARKGGAGSAVVGAGSEGTNATVQPDAPKPSPAPSWLAYGVIVLGVSVVIVATILIARKKAAVIRNWF